MIVMVIAVVVVVLTEIVEVLVTEMIRINVRIKHFQYPTPLVDVNMGE